MIEGTEILTSRGAVAAGPEEAARVGARIFEQGGNAMDAAAATSMACCMLQPQSTGVMGYVLCALVLDGRSGKVWSLDGNSIAPASASETMYDLMPMQDGPKGINENEFLCSVRDNANVHGPRAVGPPGMMAGMGVLWERWGRLKWSDIVAPALTLLENGFPFGSTAGAIRNLEAVIRRFEATEKHLMPEGRLPAPDDVWHRRDMEKSLTRACEAGWRDFYDGEIGRKIADHVSLTGGALTREDMARYEPRVTAPYETTYRDAAVYAAILPNGGLTALQVLNMLECFEPVPENTVTYWHRLAEVLKLAWRDRLLYLGDPDHVDVQVQRLLSKDYAAGRVESVRQFPDCVDQRSPKPEGDSTAGTLHVSAADVEGNVASVTISQGGAFGSVVTVPGTGLILGHGMCRLDPRPGRKNSVAPGKRPLNNTAPLMIRLPDRDVAAGLPGGRRLVSVNARFAQKIVDFGATSWEAVSGPRMHVQMEEPLMVTRSLAESIRDGLLEMGHELDVVGGVAGGAHCAEFLKSAGKVRAGGNTWAAGV
jgi:gamma-glutamyltranspeptidase/glutathione hydrolase